MKPGATGWAQINRGYNANLEDNREKLAYDLFYIKNVSFGLDLYHHVLHHKDLAAGTRWPVMLRSAGIAAVYILGWSYAVFLQEDLQFNW